MGFRRDDLGQGREAVSHVFDPSGTNHQFSSSIGKQLDTLFDDNPHVGRGAHQAADHRALNEGVRQQIQSVIHNSLGHLSSQARELVDLPEFKRQAGVYNSAMAYTKIFDHLLVSRADHQIHAASQVGLIREIRDSSPGQICMSDYELSVLEIALLFHDFGHVPGSHAMDKVISSMRDAPPIGEWGYQHGDYHEVHGAQELSRGPASRRAREVLGSPLFDDAMAVLTMYDKRPASDKAETYGDFSPTLEQPRLKVIHKLLDRLDRNSFVALDYLCAGYHESIVEQALETTQNFLKTLQVSSQGLVSNICDLTDGHVDPHAAVILARRDHFSEVPAHPTNGLVSVVLQQALWKRFQQLDASGEDGLYGRVRGQLFSSPEQLLGEELWQKLSRDTACITDEIAPLVTLDKRDLSNKGLTAIRAVRNSDAPGDLPTKLVEGMCGTRLYDASSFELQVRVALRQQGITVPVYVLVASPVDKEFKYKISTNSEVVTRYHRPDSLNELSGYVIVAAQALDDDGNPVDLSKAREVVERVIATKDWIREGVVVGEKYNPRAFVEPLNQNCFSEPVLQKMSRLQPLWIKKGGCGLINSSAADRTDTAGNFQ
jgi:HD superfamily phosphohydrolase